MSRIGELPTPALVVDLDRLEANVATMAERAAALGVRLRPHVKTHKCVEIARIQRAAGADGITVSTLYEAEVFALAGFDDITWAFPVIPSRIGQLRDLAARVRLGVVVDSQRAVLALAAAGHPFRVWIKVDCGYGRCGVDPLTDDALVLASRLAETRMELAGLLSHSGDAYEAAGEPARAAVAEQERSRIVALAERLRQAGHSVPAISVGSTPAMTAARDLEGVTEARPGNYVYFDRTQVHLGSCRPGDCALTVVASVVSASAHHCIVDAGALALSKDPGPAEDPCMGAAFGDYEAGDLDEAPRLVSLSQEHGRLDRPLPVGTRVRVLPNHSCLTAACFTHLWAARGDDVQYRWRVWNGR